MTWDTARWSMTTYAAGIGARGVGMWPSPGRAAPPLRAPARLRPYFAVPFGDMMLAGNIGLLAAAADLLPALTEPLRQALAGNAPGIAPWDKE